MKLLLATDAWHPQMNGVVRTLSTVVDTLRGSGHDVEVIGVGDFPALPLPSYPEIKISVWLRGLAARIEAFDPDAIHISTEGPIGYAARSFCLRRGHAFTTSFHTRLPEYLRERLPVPLGVTYPILRRFHDAASRTLVPTQTLKSDLEQRGFRHLQVWGRGVDTALFAPERRQDMRWVRPVWLNVGRVAPEKNIDSFLDLELPGTKVVVGDGPKLAELRRKYPDAVFPGARFGEELAAYYASADVFVFPSLTDTFGLVMIEAIACGTPVAAYPVTGPLDVLRPGVTGIMHDDLAVAAEQALQLDRDVCRNIALGLSWKAIADQFLHALVPLNEDKVPALKEAQWQSQAIPA